MSPSATPATQSDNRCHQVPRLATQRAAAATASFGNPARHQSRPSAVSATLATQSERRCHQVKIHVAKCHACHAKWPSMSPSATPATQRAAAATGPCKIVENTLEDSRKKHMERHRPRVKVKTYMEFFNTRQVHTSCKWGCVTLRWHTMLSTDAGDSGTSFNQFWCLKSLWWHTDRGGARIPSYTTVFVEGYEKRFLDGINASFCVCHRIVNLYSVV